MLLSPSLRLGSDWGNLPVVCLHIHQRCLHSDITSLQAVCNLQSTFLQTCNRTTSSWSHRSDSVDSGLWNRWTWKPFPGWTKPVNVNSNHQISSSLPTTSIGLILLNLKLSWLSLSAIRSQWVFIHLSPMNSYSLVITKLSSHPHSTLSSFPQERHL